MLSVECFYCYCWAGFSPSISTVCFSARSLVGFSPLRNPQICQWVNNPTQHPRFRFPRFHRFNRFNRFHQLKYPSLREKLKKPEENLHKSNKHSIFAPECNVIAHDVLCFCAQRPCLGRSTNPPMGTGVPDPLILWGIEH